MDEELKHRLERFEQALSKVCDLKQFERELSGTNDFEMLMREESYRGLVEMQTRYFREIRKLHNQIEATEILTGL